MRPRLDIDHDVLAAGCGLALQRECAAGEVRESGSLRGFRPVPANGTIVTDELVDELRDRDGA